MVIDQIEALHKERFKPYKGNVQISWKIFL